MDDIPSVVSSSMVRWPSVTTAMYGIVHMVSLERFYLLLLWYVGGSNLAGPMLEIDTKNCYLAPASRTSSN